MSRIPWVWVLKLALAGGLIYWILDSDKLQLSRLEVLFRDPQVALSTIGMWSLGPIVIGALRWRLLLSSVGITIKFLVVIRFQLIGSFFNTALPGAVSGDLVKALYAAKVVPGAKTQPFLSVVIDRCIGLLGVFSIGALALSTELTRIWQIESLRPLIMVIYGFLAVAVATFIFLFQSSFLDWLLQKIEASRFGLAKKFENLVQAVNAYRGKSRPLLQAWLLSVLVQGIILLYFVQLTSVINQTPLDFVSVAVVYPLGALLTSLPILPGGFGVGHVAYEKLFQMVGLENGANVFNVFFVGTLLLNMLGSIPYVLTRAEQKKD